MLFRSTISLDLSARFIERTPWVLLPLPSPCLRYRVIVTQCDDLQGGTMTDETERDQKTKASLPTPDNSDCDFVVWIGSKRLFKRRKFEKFVDSQFSL